MKGVILNEQLSKVSENDQKLNKNTLPEAFTSFMSREIRLSFVLRL
jgi:hypothetical protein